MNKTSSQNVQRRAVIVGGSLGGLIVAHMLKRIGWQVQVNERVTEDLSGRGAGLATHPELVAALARAGLSLDDRLGIPVSSRAFVDLSGAPRVRCEIPQVLTSWNRLFAILREPLHDTEYIKGRKLVEAAVENGGRIVARFEDGSAEVADLLVGADGLRSTVRALCDAHSQPEYAGYVAWRGRLPAHKVAEAGAAELVERFTVSMRDGEQFIGYPVPASDERSGAIDYNWLWYRPADEAKLLPEMCTDASGVCHGNGIPPPLLQPRWVEQLRGDAARFWPPALARAVQLTPAPFFQAIFDLRSRRLVAQRIALVGDAAFVARPHCGMGVTKAAGDAVALADALAAYPMDMAQALSAYEANRLCIGTQLVDHAKYLGGLLSALQDDGVPTVQVMAEVLTKTAVPPALHMTPG